MVTTAAVRRVNIRTHLLTITSRHRIGCELTNAGDTQFAASALYATAPTVIVALAGIDFDTIT